jgi:hypothetical protein
MPPGTWGEIWVSNNGQPYKARARVRGWDGVTRPVARFGQTKTEAKKRLLEALRDWQHVAAGSTISPNTDVKTLAEAWLGEGKKANGEPWATNTAETYRYIVDNEVVPALGVSASGS